MKDIKLGILVVYYIGDDGNRILPLHLKHIRDNTKQTNFKIYAAANRLREPFKKILLSEEMVDVVPLPTVMARESGEHGQYLDLLTQHAIAEGCTHICTFDVVSWPISPTWAVQVLDWMREDGADLVSVFREENGDTYLPHPCFLFTPVDLLRKYHANFWPDRELRENLEFKNFLQQTRQRLDTGIGFGHVVWKHKLNWKRLVRSNSVDEHYLMSGIYGNIVYHIGASSRLKIFSKEYSSTWARKWRKIFVKIPFLWNYADNLENLLLSFVPPRVHYENQRIYENLLAKLENNPDSYYEYLCSKHIE